eukprot:c26043_g1_i1 orf=138-2213(+)
MEQTTVVEQIFQRSEVLEKQAAARLTHVQGEFEDEDGDWATAFIVADPMPCSRDGFGSPGCACSRSSAAATSACSWVERCTGQRDVNCSCRMDFCYEGSRYSSSFSTSARKHQLVDEDFDIRLEHLGESAIFCCQSCKQDLPLQLVWTELNCSCLCCKPCVRSYVELRLAGIEGGNSCFAGTGDGDRNVKYPSGRTISDALDCLACFCTDSIPLSTVQSLASDAFKKWQEEADRILFQTSVFITCPGCGATIEKVRGDLPLGVAPSGVPELDRTAPFTELDNDSKPMSRLAILHRAANSFRCSLCKVRFCGLCMTIPYHLGKTCEEFEEERNAVKCRYCETPILSRELFNAKLTPSSVKDLRRELDRDGVDTLWCVEKRDLVNVLRLTSSVCRASECRKRLSQACTRSLECGHFCGGVRGERFCLPCLEIDCCQSAMPHGGSRSFLPSADELCSICLVESLRCAPSIQLICGHVIHYSCARKKLEGGFPGPEISFGYLNCPQCPRLMEHFSLVHHMEKPLELMDLVKEKALRRLRMENVPLSVRPDELEAYALQLYQYYICSKCRNPFFGGRRDCGAHVGLQNDRNENAHNPADLICGGCSAASGGKSICKKGHGKEYIEFKCRYCCSVATYFCFGVIHFCNMCHISRPDLQKDFVPKECKDSKSCPLRVVHAPNGKEHCLGCSMCRLLNQ